MLRVRYTPSGPKGLDLKVRVCSRSIPLQTVHITVGQTISSKPKGRRGSSVRQSRTWRFKEKVLLFLDEKNRRTPNVDDLAVARMFNINKSQLSAWNKPVNRIEIFAQAHSLRVQNL